MKEAQVQPEKQTVDLYDCEVRLGGHLGHTVMKAGVTMDEVILLRALHGDDAVPEDRMKQAGSKEYDRKLELFHLARTYSNTTDPISGKKIVEKVFSTALIGYDKWLAETAELEEMERDEDARLRAVSAAKGRQQAAVEAASA